MDSGQTVLYIPPAMPVLTPTDKLRRILVARTDGLGDVIVTLPIAMMLKERLPNVEISFLVTPYTAPIVQRIGVVDEVLTITQMRRGLHLFKIYKPDAVIFAKPDFRLALEAVLARIDVRVGTGYRWYSGLFTRWVYEHRRTGAKHEAQYGVNLLTPILDGDFHVTMPRLPVSSPGLMEARRRLGECGIVGDYVVIHPGSRGSALMYEPELYAAVADELLADRPDLSIVVTAGPAEEELAGRVVDAVRSSGRIAVVDAISLDGLSELLRGAQGFLGSSSGPAHLAALVGTPVVARYPGLPPMWPARWKPLGDHVTTLVPHPDEPFCALCGKKHQPENCVKRISTKRVVEACQAMLVGRDTGESDYIS